GKSSSISSSIAPDKVYQTPPTVAAPKVISDGTSVGSSFPFALLLSLSFSESQAAMISNNRAAKVICNFLITLPPNIVGDPTKNKFVFLSSLIKRFIFVRKLCSGNLLLFLYIYICQLFNQLGSILVILIHCMFCS